MKKISEIIESLKNNGIEFEISFDGGRGIFKKGSMKGMTVIWSYGGGWEHISIDGKKRMPEWEEMCFLKDMFFNDDECVVQYHPPKSEYVNNLKYCLHLWKPIEEYAGVLPMPPSILVGIKGLKLGE